MASIYVTGIQIPVWQQHHLQRSQLRRHTPRRHQNNMTNRSLDIYLHRMMITIFHPIVSLMTRPVFLLTILSFVAGVPRNQPKPIKEGTTPYHNPEDWNSSHEMWKNLNIDSTHIALTQEEIKAFGLPPSQPFPWDITQSIYVVHGMHSLHCLVSFSAFFYMALSFFNSMSRK